MTIFLLLMATAVVVSTVLASIYHLRRPREPFSPLADGLRALRSVQNRPGLTP